MTAPDALARPVWAEVELGAISHNLDLLRTRAGRPVRMIVPVKANAYGHGAAEVAPCLERLGVDALATANADEAVGLRARGVRLPILMYGSQLPGGVSFLLSHGLTPTIYDRNGLDAAAAAAGDQPVAVHVKVDAGFGRLGVGIGEVAAFVGAVLAEPRLVLEGVYTHVPFVDQAGEAWARQRLAEFTDLVRGIEAANGIRIPYAQAAASAALFRGIPDELNAVAPGHLTYGLCPIAGMRAETLGFQPALRAVRAQLIHVGARRAAVVLLGIDNGYACAPGATVLVRGRRCPVLSVTAEYTAIDVSDLPAAAVGDVATIVGRDGDEAIDVDEVAGLLGAPSPAYWLMGLRKLPIRYAT
jgi:alanine racemase